MDIASVMISSSYNQFDIIEIHYSATKLIHLHTPQEFLLKGCFAYHVPRTPQSFQYDFWLS